MYPIIIVLAIGIAIAIERFLFLQKTAMTNSKVWNDITPLLEHGKFKQAAEITSESSCALGVILTYGISRIKTTRRREDIEQAMEESLMEFMPKLEKRTHYLATFANVATLLGLLGTIIGLIQAFTAVANANPADKADLLSASISIAMNTTAFGLMAAIPLLLIHAMLQTKTTALEDNMEMAVVKFLNSVTEARHRKQAEMKRAQKAAAAQRA